MVDQANGIIKSQLYIPNVTVASEVFCYNNQQRVNASIYFAIGKDVTDITDISTCACMIYMIVHLSCARVNSYGNHQ